MNKSLSVLLVDDEPMIIKSVSRYLQMRNCHITACGDGQTAMEIAGTRHFDVVVADFNLPHLNGLQLLRHLKSMLPDCRLIMTSGSTTPEVLAGAHPPDYITFLSKPFELESLLRLLHA